MADIASQNLTFEEQQLHRDIRFTTLQATLKAVTDTSYEIVMNSFSKILDDSDVIANVKNGFMPYIFAAGFLSFAGREISSQNMSGVLGAINIEFNEQFMQIMNRISVKSHLIYVYAYYFLLSNGMVADVQGISKVVSSIGIYPDAKGIEDVISYITLNQK